MFIDTIRNMSNEALNALCRIESNSPENWWFYPPEDETHVQGFHGTGDIFIVGVRPSLDDWPKSHPNRRALYDLLADEGATDCHLTDFFKRRGPGDAKQLRGTIPLEFDFKKNLEVLAHEVKLLQPSTILAMGNDANYLLRKHTDFGARIIQVCHFGMAYHGDKAAFQSSVKRGLDFARALQK